MWCCGMLALMGTGVKCTFRHRIRIAIVFVVVVVTMTWVVNTIATNVLRHASDENSNSLPTCVELMQQQQPLLSSLADGPLLTRKGTPVVWKKRSDGSGELTLPLTCHLKRYTAREAGWCLKNKSILFVGDSLTRYQFTALAFFFEHKKHQPRFVFSNSCTHVDELGNLACSTTDKSKLTYPQLGGGIDGGVFNGRMEAMAINAPYKIRDKTTVRMQYVGSKTDGGIKLNFAMEVGTNQHHTFGGWNLTGCTYNASCRQMDNEYHRRFQRLTRDDFDWQFPSITDAFQSNGTVFYKQFLEGMNYAIYNRGIWGQIGLDKAKKMTKSLHRITRGQSEDPSNRNRCFFKSTTAVAPDANAIAPIKNGKNELWERGPIRNATYHSGCEYFDVFHLTEEFGNSERENKGWDIFTDGIHYQPWVYEELNNILLNVLCNAHI